MKKFTFFIIFIALISFFIPYFGEKITRKDNIQPNNIIKLYDKKLDKITEIPINDYLFFVVSAEMPASFHTEAIKAQIICARTYSVKKKQNHSHENGADLCTDITHCQAYTDNALLKEKWGDKYTYYKKKIKNAIEETNNKIITHNNEPIDAIYHSSNNGYTENSEDVWREALPYLRSVKSPDENSPNFNVTTRILSTELFSIINKEYPNADMKKGIGNITYTEGKNVKNINLYSIDISGKKLRELLNLKSASFDIKEKDDAVQIITHGYGHGVGLSQYGANEMAKKGILSEDIIRHYYQNVEISNLE